MLDRRAFLYRLGFGSVSAAAAVLTFDVEQLLWVPKTIITVPEMPKPFVMAGVHGSLLTDGTFRALARYAHGLADHAYRNAFEVHELMLRNGR